MPTSTTAPKTGRDISKRVLLALFVAFATVPGAAPALAQPAPIPLPAQPASPAMGYYMMQGNRIVAGPYSSGPACMKAIATLMKSLPANTAPIVCAHRKP
jgi:hypothetical protein